MSVLQDAVAKVKSFPIFRTKNTPSREYFLGLLILLIVDTVNTSTFETVEDREVAFFRFNDIFTITTSARNDVNDVLREWRVAADRVATRGTVED